MDFLEGVVPQDVAPEGLAHPGEINVARPFGRVAKLSSEYSWLQKCFTHRRIFGYQLLKAKDVTLFWV